ncbi:hypothetical protein [Cardiobacterium hominis]|jgi:hypothetical protein|uniref:hypothetical protein n=1 Tax=Cardiobacterium hominis TaxID=2718 RepID=UPI000F0FBC3A|nr:hypothetical protein [Cardiobacterium hominis]RKW19467.1 MAG: hypothetical protein D8H94_00840 [Cardiobacterium sp.]
MSKLTEAAELLDQLPAESRRAITTLIDLKTEDNMDKVLNKLDSMTETFNARFELLEKTVDVRLKALDDKIDTKFDALTHRINAIYWFIGAVVTLAVAVLRYLPPSSLH